MSTFSERLRGAMAQAGVKQLQLSKRIGLSRVTVSRWLCGDTPPGWRVLQDVARELDVNPEWLAGDDVPMERTDSVNKRKLYLAGKMTGTTDYKERFAAAQDQLEEEGYIVLNPAWQPEGLTKADYMRHCMAMIDTADEVALLPGWSDSPGAQVEYMYCRYVQKPIREVEV